MFRPPTPLVKNLLIINIGIFLLGDVLGWDLNSQFGLYYILSDQFQPYQFVTYMFLHGDWGHLLNNMLILFFVGPMLEGFLGPKKFLILYAVTGLGGGILYMGANYLEIGDLRGDVRTYVSNPNPDDFNRLINKHVDNLNPAVNDFIDRYARNENNNDLRNDSVAYAYQLTREIGNFSMVGASGAMFGILAMLMILFPNTEILLFFTFPIKIKYLVGALIFYEIYSEFQRVPGDNVAHLAHLGGALFAWLLHRYWQKDRKNFY